MPEVIDEGVTGFLVEDVDRAVDAVRLVRTLDRRSVRARAALRFSSDRMVEDYLRLYQRVVRR